MDCSMAQLYVFLPLFRTVQLHSKFNLTAEFLPQHNYTASVSLRLFNALFLSEEFPSERNASAQSTFKTSFKC